ncbi:hypothetical protein L3Q82_026905, partial [Scortum barcoo]
MYFLRRLRSFNICSKLLQMFYQSVVASVLFYTVVCWGGSISKKDTSRLDKLIRRAGSVVGMKLDSLVTVAELRTLDKLLDIMDNASHPLHTVISNQRSLFSERLLLPKWQKACVTAWELVSELVQAQIGLSEERLVFFGASRLLQLDK